MGLRILGWAAGAVVVCTLGFTACNKKQADGPAEILIGEYGAMTGATATFGQSTHKGITMALDEINASGGILGRKVKVIAEDDQGRPEEAQTAVTKLISKDRVSAILGEVASSNSLAAAPVCQQNRIPMVTPASTNPKVTMVGDCIFRICFIDPFQGQVMAKFAWNTLKVKQVAILRDVKSDYSVGLANFFKQGFETLGGHVLVDESYSQGDKDFEAQLTSIKSRNPEAVFIPGYYTDVGLIVRQARELGITGPLLGGDGWDSEKLWEIGGEALNGGFFSNHYSVDDPSPAIQNFVATFRKRNGGSSPDAMAALGYDAAKVLFDAIRRAGSDNPDSIRIALAQTNGYPGVTGSIKLNENRDAVKPAVVLEVKDGKFVFKETVSP